MAIVVVVLAGLITGGVLLLSGGDSSFTYQGKSISGAAKALDQAQTNLNKVVTQRHGVTSSSTRCYFALPTDPAKGQ